MKGFLARREYKEILKRLARGKKVGARMGMWTNGTPPFPYEYQRWNDKFNEKGLVVNDDKYKTYRFMIESVIQNKNTTDEIAYKLNKQQIPGPRGGIWHGTTIYRLLIDETHLGKIISNKSRGDAHKKKKPSSKEFEVLPKSEWVIVNNCHEAVKTQVEHEKILIFLNRLKRRKRSVGKKLPFTGLIKCGKCNHTLSIIERKDRKGILTIQTCWYKDALGNKCGNSGGPLQLIYDVVNQELENYEIKIQSEVDKDADAEINEITNMISTCEDTIKLKLNSITRIQQAYEAEAYTLDEYKTRKKTVTKEIHLLEDELKVLKYRLKHVKSLTNQQRMNLIYEFKKIIKSENLTYEEQNELYKSIIESIVWKREGDNIEIEVNFI